MQTIIGRYWPNRLVAPRWVDREITLADGDRLRVADSTPPRWSPGDPIALIVHGLAGCARSPYVERMANRLDRQGIRTLRLNLRGAGSGFGLARGIYHAGRSEDLRSVVEETAHTAPRSPIAMVGFSLGASLVLKLAAESASQPLAGLDCVLAANPPLDLAVCSATMSRIARGVYNRNFVLALRSDIQRLHSHFPDLDAVDLCNVRTVHDFDDRYTAPRHGFRGAADYYAQCSAGPRVCEIQVPGLVVHSEDDPFIPAETVSGVVFPLNLALELFPSGGHLGFVSRTRWVGDHRWLEARLSAWLADHWSTRLPDAEAADTFRQRGPIAHESRPNQ